MRYGTGRNVGIKVLGASRSGLMLDSFHGYNIDVVKARLSGNHTYLVMTPGSMISVLQSLNVRLNRPFKADVKWIYTKWMAEGLHYLTPTGGYEG